MERTEFHCLINEAWCDVCSYRLYRWIFRYIAYQYGLSWNNLCIDNFFWTKSKRCFRVLLAKTGQWTNRLKFLHAIQDWCFFFIVAKLFFVVDLALSTIWFYFSSTVNTLNCKNLCRSSILRNVMQEVIKFFSLWQFGNLTLTHKKCGKPLNIFDKKKSLLFIFNLKKLQLCILCIFLLDM